MNNVIAVIVTYNIGNRLIKSIETLKNQVKQIIIVDNGSNLKTIDMLKSIEHEIDLILLNKNKGIGYALNRGIERALEIDCDWIITLDHDSIAEENMIDKMLYSYSIYEGKDSVGMITPIHVEEKSNTAIKKQGVKNILTEITSGSMVKSYIYKNIIKYNESLFIDLVDHDFCLRLNKEGYLIIQDESAVLLHNLGESVTKKIFGIKLTYTNHNEIRRYYMTRNRFYLWQKYKEDFSEWVKLDKIRFIRETIKVIVFEKNKMKKIKYSICGYRDYKKRILGECSLFK